MYQGALLSKSLKTMKSDGAGLGFLTKILYLAPSRLSGYNVCPHASTGCAAACLNRSGNGYYPVVQKARVQKTLMYFQEREKFLQQLISEIQKFVIHCAKRGQRPAIRLNGTSDISWEKICPLIFTLFPNVQFYDYTKNYKRMIKFCDGDFPSNYHLTFSRSESNQKEVEDILSRGGNVSVVFFNSFPKTWKRKKVHNGDLHDLRFLDKKGVIGLKAKGVGRSDNSGFVI